MAVAPSACGALTSAFCCSRTLSLALSPFIAASATGQVPAPAADKDATRHAALAAVRYRRPIIPHSFRTTSRVTHPHYKLSRVLHRDRYSHQIITRVHARADPPAHRLPRESELSSGGR